MFALAWLLLPDLPTYRTGLIIVGLARCIAMVLIWNDSFRGHREAAAVLVALNSLSRSWRLRCSDISIWNFFPMLGLSTQGLHLSVWKIAETVAIFLGIPLLAGYSRERLANACVVESGTRPDCCPGRPFALYGLLYTIVILFACRAHDHSRERRRSHSPATALLLRIMWLGRSRSVVRSGFPTIERHPSPSPRWQQLRTGDAVCIGVFGVTSGEALAGVWPPHRGKYPLPWSTCRCGRNVVSTHRRR